MPENGTFYSPSILWVQFTGQHFPGLLPYEFCSKDAESLTQHDFLLLFEDDYFTVVNN